MPEELRNPWCDCNPLRLQDEDGELKPPVSDNKMNHLDQLQVFSALRVVTLTVRGNAIYKDELVSPP